MNTNSRINFLAASVVAALTLGGCSVFMDGPTPLPVSIEASGHDGNGPDRLIDGDIKTRWSASGAGSWAVVDYGVKAKFNAVKLAFHKGDQRASIFDVETSIDGENWTKVLSQARSSGATLNLERFEFADIQARFIRVTGYGNSSNKWNSFTEFVGVNCNVDDCPDSELPPLTPVAVTSSEHDGNGPDRLIDGDIKTRWSASGDGSWAILDYGSVQEFDAVRLAFHKGNKRSTYFDIEFSEDGDNWKPIITDGKSSGVFKTRERFEFEPAKAQYVRYVGHGNSSNKWNSVTEFSAVNCSINDCPVDEVKTEALIAEAKRKAAEKKAKKKAEKSKPKARPGDFGIHVPLVCDPVVSDCSCLKTNPECQWWETPLPAITYRLYHNQVINRDRILTLAVGICLCRWTMMLTVSRMMYSNRICRRALSIQRCSILQKMVVWYSRATSKAYVLQTIPSTYVPKCVKCCAVAICLSRARG